jgi:hypothetical protein
MAIMSLMSCRRCLVAGHRQELSPWVTSSSISTMQAPLVVVLPTAHPGAHDITGRTSAKSSFTNSALNGLQVHDRRDRSHWKSQSIHVSLACMDSARLTAQDKVLHHERAEQQSEQRSQDMLLAWEC